jgi:hypothetical protein
MILAALLLLAQDVPAPASAPAEENEEIVVRATYGTTTMLFDKGQDNRLRNCRIMVSSGSQRRDTNACQATPVCYAKTADVVTDCVALTMLEPVAIGGARSALGTGAPQVFDLPKLVKPKPAPSFAIAGPLEPGDNPMTDKQRVTKLPPPPKSPNEPAVRITNAQDQ